MKVKELGETEESASEEGVITTSLVGSESRTIVYVSVVVPCSNIAVEPPDSDKVTPAVSLSVIV